MLDQDQETLIKLRGKRFKSYAEKFVPPVHFCQAVSGKSDRPICGRSWRNDFHMKSGMKYLIEVFLPLDRRDTPVPIPYREILLTAKIMDAIFVQLDEQQQQLAVLRAPVATAPGDICIMGNALIPVCGEISMCTATCCESPVDGDKYTFPEDPEALIAATKKCRTRIDLLTFLERVPKTKPRFSYPMEWDNLAALPVSTFDHWWNKQMRSLPRNRARQAEKKGVAFREVPFDDELVKGFSTFTTRPHSARVSGSRTTARASSRCTPTQAPSSSAAPSWARFSTAR